MGKGKGRGEVCLGGCQYRERDLGREMEMGAVFSVRETLEKGVWGSV